MAEIATLVTPIFQTVNGVKRKLLPETIATQVKFDNGTNLEARITALENQSAGKTTTYVVNDIAERNALTDLVVGDQAWVKNATADPSVTRGGAKYIWETSTVDGETVNVWTKTAETESMDLAIKWTDIDGRPTSSPDAIDVAVNVVGTMDGHELTVSTETGDLLLDGNSVGGKYGAYLSADPEDEESVNAALAAAKLPDGAFFTILPGGGESA